LEVPQLLVTVQLTRIRACRTQQNAPVWRGLDYEEHISCQAESAQNGFRDRYLAFLAQTHGFHSRQV